MLNNNNQRELAYVVQIDAIEPIPGSDNCECVVVGGWHVMVHKNEFKVGDLGIYFEIDSHLDITKPEFEFLCSKHGNIKTQKYTFGGKGNFISQGLVMHPSVFGWKILAEGTEDNSICYQIAIETPTGVHSPADESKFLTDELGVTYAVAEDNKRKSSGVDKYKVMAQRHIKLAKTFWWRWFYKRTWGKKLLFFFFGKKQDKKKDWPSWVVKTDEERIENMPWVLNERDENGEKLWWIPTEKIDGTSTTFTAKRRKFGKIEFYVCSRNVVFDKPEKEDKLYYEQNYYTQMAGKYEVEKLLTRLLEVNPDIDWFTIQGETFGEGIQKRDYGLKEPEIRVFNLIDSKNGRWGSDLAEKFLKSFYKRNKENRIVCEAELKWVPLFEPIQLPDTIEELREYVHSMASKIDGGMREGVVFRTIDGKRSFKCVDPDYLLQYHL